MTRGKLIVIDGGDGAGKQTQTGLLETRLRAEGLSVTKLAFPRYDQYFGGMVRRYLDGQFGDPTRIDPRMASLLYAFDRSTAAPEINRALDAGVHVICDRYIESNMGFQTAKIDDEGARNAFLLWLEDLEYGQLGVPKSDLVLYLHASADVSRRLAEARAADDSSRRLDGHERDLAFQSRVVDTYKWLARKYPHWRLVDCLDDAGTMRPKERIHEELYGIAMHTIRQ